MKSRLALILLAAAALLPGCIGLTQTVELPTAAVPATVPATAATAESATESATSNESAAAATSETLATPPLPDDPPTPTPLLEPAAPTEPSEPQAEPAPPTSFDPAVSPLFGTRWDDRDAYAAGLLPERAALLDELPDAPVYHLQLDIDDTMRRVDGRLAVRAVNQEATPLDELYFHLLPNVLNGEIEVSEVRVNGEPTSPDIDPRSGHVMRVLLSETLQPGDAAVVEMGFRVAAPTDIGRNYGIFAYYDDILALAHFYPMLAVYDDEGWNVTEPDIQGDVTYSDTSYYLVEVSAPAEQVLAASGVAIDRDAGGERQTVTYAAGPVRDFYLVSSDTYEVISETVDGVVVTAYAPDWAAEGAAWTIDVAAAALDTYSRRFSRYPFTELDIVATPTSALGIEYPGIIAITNRIYDLSGMTMSGVPFSSLVETTTAHEVVHQWLYGLVGNDQLDEPWIDEGMTTFATYLYFVDRYGADAAETQAYVDNVNRRWEQVGFADIPIGLPVSAYEDAEYSAIVYGRGALFGFELRDVMGEEAFDRFLLDYAAQYELGLADTDGFRATAEAACGCDLGPLFEAWVYEK